MRIARSAVEQLATDGDSLPGPTGCSVLPNPPGALPCLASPPSADRRRPHLVWSGDGKTTSRSRNMARQGRSRFGPSEVASSIPRQPTAPMSRQSPLWTQCRHWPPRRQPGEEPRKRTSRGDLSQTARRGLRSVDPLASAVATRQNMVGDRLARKGNGQGTLNALWRTGWRCGAHGSACA